MHFDLHMHSVNSHDGFYSEKELIARAKEKKLDLIALCDHNTTAGIPAIIKEGSKQNLSVIAGIELDTLFEGHEIHILGYNIDPSYPYFADLSKKIDNLEKKALKERIEKVIDYFHLQPESERLMNVAAASTTPFASVIQDILSDSRYREITAFDPYRKEGGNVFFFWDYCSAEGPCHVSVDYPGLKENIQHIHNAGGIAIMERAEMPDHPACGRRQSFGKDFRTHHPHRPDQRFPLCQTAGTVESRAILIRLCRAAGGHRLTLNTDKGRITPLLYAPYRAIRKRWLIVSTNQYWFAPIPSNFTLKPRW